MSVPEGSAVARFVVECADPLDDSLPPLRAAVVVVAMVDSFMVWMGPGGNPREDAAGQASGGPPPRFPHLVLGMRSRFESRNAAIASSVCDFEQGNSKASTIDGAQGSARRLAQRTNSMVYVSSTIPEDKLFLLRAVERRTVEEINNLKAKQ